MKTARKPPKHLTSEAKREYSKIVAEYGLDDDAGLLILQTAMEALDRLRDAQAQIKCDGSTVTDRWGQIKPHPLLPTERDARSQLLAGLKALNLDLEPLKDRPGRPSGGLKVGYPHTRSA